MSRRDDFTKKTVELLARRSGGRCSMCNCATWGPNDSPYSATNIGQAAHISAAAEGGPRYDPKLTPEQRSSAKNGLWLCSNCHDKVDRNVSSYDIKFLHELKKTAESRAKSELGVTAKTRETPPPGDALLATVSGVAIVEIRKLKSLLGTRHNNSKISDEDAMEFLSSIDFLNLSDAHYLSQVGKELIGYLHQLLGYASSASVQLEIVRHLSDIAIRFAQTWKEKDLTEFSELIKTLMKGRGPRDAVYQSSMALLKDLSQIMSSGDSNCHQVVKDTMMEVARQQGGRRGRQRGGDDKEGIDYDEEGPLAPSIKRSRLAEDDNEEERYVTNMCLLAGNDVGCHDNAKIEEEIDELGFEYNIL